LGAIARQWNAAGITSTRGAAWNTSRIKRLLLNPRYAGLRAYRGAVVDPGTWQPILDADTHAGLVAVLKDKSRGFAVSYERKYLGSHRYVCGVCGAKMEHSVSTHADGRRFSRYRCTASTHLSRTQPELDAYVESVVLAYLSDEERLHKILAEKRNDVDVDGLRTRRTALAAQKDELATLFTDGVLDGPAVRRESSKLTTSIAAIDTTLADAARRNPVAELIADGPEMLEKRWAALSPDLKGKIIDEIFTVTVNPSPLRPLFPAGVHPHRIEDGMSFAEMDITAITIVCDNKSHARGKVAEFDTRVKFGAGAAWTSQRQFTESGRQEYQRPDGTTRQDWTCKLCGLSFEGSEETISRVLDPVAPTGESQVNLRALNMPASRQQ
jgi:Recombinase